MAHVRHDEDDVGDAYHIDDDDGGTDGGGDICGRCECSRDEHEEGQGECSCGRCKAFKDSYV